MAVHAKHIVLLVLGFIFLMDMYWACVLGRPFGLGFGARDHVHAEPGKETNLETENKGNDFSMLRKRDLSFGGFDFGSFFNTPSESTPSKSTPSESTPSENTPSESSPSESSSSESTLNGSTQSETTQSEIIPSGNTSREISFSTGGGKRLEMYNIAGITIRAVDLKNHQDIMVSNNEIFVGDKLVCDDINNLDTKITYRKSSDGTYWHTNVKIGEPMTHVEEEEFESDWDHYEKKLEAKRRRKEALKKQRKQVKRAERERKRQRKEAGKRLREVDQEIKRLMKIEERVRKEKEEKTKV